ncbi:16S rRNA (guanine(527)-N(7))-methyltransferase RsmG [candidate division KSB1 bacterium]
MFHVKQDSSGERKFETIYDWKRMMDLNGFKYDDEILERFKFYHFQILKWNKKAKLVSRNDEKRLISRHFIESLLFLKGFPFNDEMVVGDLGSGAGFPGLVISLFNPGLKMYLIESNKKKTVFLSLIIEELGLKNTEIIHQRVETLGREKEFLEFFDVITARAVAKYQRIVDWVQPVLKIKTGNLIIPRLAFQNKKFDVLFSNVDWTNNRRYVNLFKDKKKQCEKLEFQVFTRQR